jgi:hypothetical protein
MNKQFTSIISITFSIVLAIGAWLYFTKIDEKRINPILAVPDNMALAIETDQSSQRLKQLDNTTFMDRLLMNESLSTAFGQLLFVDSLLHENGDILNWFENGKAVYSIHTFENGTNGILLSLQTLDEVNPEIAENFFQKHFPGRFKMSKRKFVNEYLYDFTDFKANTTYTVGFRNKLMFFSPHGNLVEQAMVKLGQINYNQVVEDKLAFVRKNGNGMLFHFNYQNLGKLLKSQTSPLLDLPFTLVGNFAERATYEMELDDEDITLKGAALTHETKFQFLDVFNAQAPLKNTLTEQLPDGLNFSLTLGFNNYKSWSKNVQEYLLSKGLNRSYQAYADSIENTFTIKFVDKLAGYFQQHAAIISADEPGFWKDSTYAIAIEVNDQNNALALLSQLAQSRKLVEEKDSLMVDSVTYSQIHPCYLGDLFKYYFTDVFEGFTANYYTYHNGYIYFANQAQLLQKFQVKWIANKLITEAPNYKAFAKKMVSSSNLELCIYNDHAPKYALNFVNENLMNLINRNMGSFKRAQYAAIQFAGSNDKVFATQCYVRFNLSKPEKNELMWEVPVDTALAIQPMVVQHPVMLTPVIMVQDLHHQLYMFDREGKQLWKRTLDGPILSKISELNVFKNGKKYLSFNTAKQIYLIDENGKDLAGWPAWIPTGTKYPVAIIDPIGDFNYQFVATGIYYKVSAFNAQGRLLPVWNPKEVWPNLVQTVNYLTYNGQTLLAALNEQGFVSYYTLAGRAFTEIPKDSGLFFVSATFQQKDTGTFIISAKDSLQSYEIEISSSKGKKLQIVAKPSNQPTPETYPVPVFGPALKGNLFNEADEWLIFADEQQRLKLYHLR